MARLDTLKGVKCQMDDVIVYGSSQEDHKRNLVAALQRIADSKMTLNYDKCLFFKKQVPFLGSAISAEGLVPRPEKLRAITEMVEPNPVTDVRRFLGMANQLGKYSPHLAETTRPLRGLLSKEKSGFEVAHKCVPSKQ